MIKLVWPTVGELAWLVRSSPYTTHGWRPISVKIQPNQFARIPRQPAGTASHSHQRRRSIVRRQRKNAPSSVITMIAVPVPIISRKLQ